MITLDVDSVQAFVLVADLRSFTKAAEALDTSQAAVSVKLKRLEDKLGQKLIERTPRFVRLSVQGAAFLDAGRAFLASHERAIAGLSTQPRKLALGINVHVAGPELPVLLARLNVYDPALCMEVHIDTSRDLLAAYDKGVLDAVIVRREDNRRDGEVLSQDRFGWFASPDFERRDSEPLRLASLASSCGVRSIATRALDAADIAWNEVFVGGGMSAVGAAVSIGLAVAVLACRVAPVGTMEVGERLGLPRLPEFDIVMHSSLSDGRSRGALRTLATAFRDHR